MTGRIGDTPLVGAGGYADNEVGFDLNFFGVKKNLFVSHSHTHPVKSKRLTTT